MAQDAGESLPNLRRTGQRRGRSVGTAETGGVVRLITQWPHKRLRRRGALGLRDDQAGGLHARTRPAACPLRACEYELAGTGGVVRRVLAGWLLVVPGDSLRA